MPHAKNHQPQIVLIAGIILMITTLLAGATVFVVMQRHAEALLSASLQLSLQNRIKTTRTEIAAGFDKTLLIATRPLLLEQLQLVNAQDGAARNRLTMFARSFLPTGFTAIALYGEGGQELARAGVFVQQPELALSINFPGHVQLLWNGQLLLQSLVDVKKQGRVIGKVMTQMPLTVATATLKDASRLGETGEQALCAPFGIKMQCFPTTLSPRIITAPQRLASGVRLPMTHAFEGETGFIIAKDYRHQEVVAAYAPVGDLGLGMVLKMDSRELYAPVWGQLRYLIPLLAGVLVIAMLLLRLLLTPLVTRLVRSEAQAAQRTTELTKEFAERERAEVELLRFKNVLDNTLDMIFMFESESLRFVYLSQGAVVSMGYSREELLGMMPYEIKPLIPEQKFRQLIAPLKQGDQSILQFETLHRRKDGTDFPVDISLQLVKESSTSSLFVAIVRDITERKIAEQMKSEFVSTVSHELRTPLTSISGALGLIAGGALGEVPQQARAMIAIAHENSLRLTLMINDLLDMDKLTASKMHFDMQTQPLMPLLERALEANRCFGSDRGVMLILTGAAPDAEVSVDSQRLMQVLANLLSNAIKYSPDQGTVEVAVNLQNEWVRVAVIDQGQGIPAQFHARIFQKFSQADSSDTRQKGGSGLGLAIAREMVERMGGKLSFESVEGEGATFYFELPILPS